MDSNDLTREQWRQLERIIGKLAQFLAKMVERIKPQEFPEDDKLRVQTLAAYSAVLNLWHDTHSGSCGTRGVGFGNARSPPGPPEPKYDKISKRIAPAFAAANEHRRWKR